MRILLPFAIFGLLASCHTTRPAALSLALPDWSPDLIGPIRLIEERLNSCKDEGESRHVFYNLSELYDARLWLILQGQLDKLPTEIRTEVIDEQRRWLAKRERAIKRVYEEYDYGSGAPSAGAMTSIKMTQKRIENLLGEAR